MTAETGQTAEQATIPIFYLIDFLSYGGGMENQLAWLLKKLDRRRFDPHLVCLRPEFRSTTKDVGCPIEHLDVDKLRSPKAFGAIYRLARLLRRNRSQILQIFSVDSNVIGVPAARLAGVPHVVVCRRDMGLWYDSGPLRLVNLVNRMAHHGLVNSEAVKQAMAARESLPAGQIHVIHNGIPQPVSTGETALTRDDIGVPKNVPLIGMVANMRPWKRIDRLVRVLGMMKNREAHLILVGHGPGKEDLRQLAVSIGVEERIHFHQTVKQTLDIMKLFTVGVLTSDSEGLSNVLIEYALLGIPAVAFDAGGNREVIADGATGWLVPPYDEKIMAEKIDSLLGSPDQAARMGKAAVKHARDEFSLEKMVAATQDFYLDILGQSEADG